MERTGRQVGTGSTLEVGSVFFCFPANQKVKCVFFTEFLVIIQGGRRNHFSYVGAHFRDRTVICRTVKVIGAVIDMIKSLCVIQRQNGFQYQFRHEFHGNGLVSRYFQHIGRVFPLIVIV